MSDTTTLNENVDDEGFLIKLPDASAAEYCTALNPKFAIYGRGCIGAQQQASYPYRLDNL